MCKYCNMIPEIYNYGDTNITYVGEEDICDSKYEYCKIVYNNDKYYIVLRGSYEDYSEPISCCPFCGRKLKDN